MQVRYLPDKTRFQRMTTAELRESFLIENLFAPGELQLVYVDVDRAIVGSAVPVKEPLSLGTSKELASEFFAQRREIGVLNVGGPGKIVVDGKTFAMDNRDCLYIGRGSREITFSSEVQAKPAMYYLVSYPAHAQHPTTQAHSTTAAAVHLGVTPDCNVRTIRKYIHPAGIASCQLVMGFTELEEGSVWNTMPAHTHERRSEVYLYFDIAQNATVFHLMGGPEETRHLVVHNRQVVLSPSWSIHSGVGTRNYTFVWAMGGENQDFDDQDGVPVADLR